jgi:hypothetical protein
VSTLAAADNLVPYQLFRKAGNEFRQPAAPVSFAALNSLAAAWFLAESAALGQQENSDPFSGMPGSAPTYKGQQTGGGRSQSLRINM